MREIDAEINTKRERVTRLGCHLLHHRALLLQYWSPFNNFVWLYRGRAEVSVNNTDAFCSVENIYCGGMGYQRPHIYSDLWIRITIRDPPRGRTGPSGQCAANRRTDCSSRSKTARTRQTIDQLMKEEGRRNYHIYMNNNTRYTFVGDPPYRYGDCTYTTAP